MSCNNFMSILPKEPAPDPTYEDLRSVIRQLHASSETNNIGLHRSLHDELGALIVSAAMDLAAIAVHPQGAGPADFRLTRAYKSMIAAVDVNRRLSENLRPSLLDNLGLFAALRWHIKHDCAHSSAVCSEHYPEEEMKLSPAATTGLYRIGQESLAMVFAEPNLKSVDFQIKVDHGHLEMTLTHDHVGHEPVDLFGDTPELMHSLAERARALGGEMSVARSDTGTALILRFPVERIT
jgi:signal transduction histidine kinase